MSINYFPENRDLVVMAAFINSLNPHTYSTDYVNHTEKTMYEMALDAAQRVLGVNRCEKRKQTNEFWHLSSEAQDEDHQGS